MKYLELKFLVNILFFLFVLSVFSQPKGSKEDIEEAQKQGLQNANEKLLEGKLERAISSYEFVKRLDSTSIKGKLAASKSDSLQKAFNKYIKEQIIGKWIWKETGTNWGTLDIDANGSKDRILVIDENNISFYEKDESTSRLQLVKREKLNFSKIKSSLPSIGELLYSDKQIWQVRFKENAQILHLMNTGEVVGNSRIHIGCGNIEMTYQRIE